MCNCVAEPRLNGAWRNRGLPKCHFHHAKPCVIAPLATTHRRDHVANHLIIAEATTRRLRRSNSISAFAMVQVSVSVSRSTASRLFGRLSRAALLAFATVLTVLTPATAATPLLFSF